MVMISRRSICCLCGEPIAGEPASGFRHFVRNRNDPLAVFSDAPFHRRCFSVHPLRDQVLERLAYRERKMKSRVCVVCGENIKDDWYTTDYLTDEPASPLFRFNYVHCHRSHLHLWNQYEVFRGLVEEFVRSGKYDGPPILPKES